MNLFRSPVEQAFGYLSDPMRVLLVEDDHMIGESANHALKDASYAVDWVRDGDAALAAIATQPYDVVLLDLGLPKKDGLEVLRRIRSKDNPVPVLVVAARDAVQDRIAGCAAQRRAGDAVAEQRNDDTGPRNP